MKAPFLFSIAISLFIITFLSYPTRIDPALDAIVSVDKFFVGDLVLVSGASIVLGLIGSVAKAFKK